MMIVKYAVTKSALSQTVINMERASNNQGKLDQPKYCKVTKQSQIILCATYFVV